MNRFLAQCGAVIGKELRVELRTREILYTMIFFGLVIVVVFGFSLFEKSTATLAAPGVLWTALLLAGTVSVNRTFEREREGSCLTGLMLVPGIGWSLFVGKAVANLVFLLLTLMFVAPLVLLVFQYTHIPNPGGVMLALFLGAVGYAVLGTLVGGMLGQVRMRAILLPLVLFPMVIPVFGIGVTATANLLRSGDAQAVKFELDGVGPGSPLAVTLDGRRFETVVGRDGAAAAEVLAAQVEHALDTASLRAMRISRTPNELGFTVSSHAGYRFEYETVGLSHEVKEIKSEGWGYLPVLAMLDLVLLFVSLWLFGRLLETG